MPASVSIWNESQGKTKSEKTWEALAIALITYLLTITLWNPTKNWYVCLPCWKVRKNLFGKHWNEYLSAYCPEPQRQACVGKLKSDFWILGCRVGRWYMERMVIESQESHPVLPVLFPTANKGAACLYMNGFSSRLLWIWSRNNQEESKKCGLLLRDAKSLWE